MHAHASPTGGLRGHFPATAGTATWFPRPAAAGEPRTIDRFEEGSLVRRARAGNRQAVERLVQANLGLIRREARRYSVGTQSFEDMVQEGLLAFLGALDGYDPDRGYRLMSYALHWVRPALARAAAQDRSLIRRPVDQAEELRCLLALRAESAQRLGRFPTCEELAEASGLTEEQVVALLDAGPEIVSLEARVGPDGESTLMELLEDPQAVDLEQDALQRLGVERIRGLLERLPERERRVVEERFGFGEDGARIVEEISRRLRIPRERIRQLEAAAMRRLPAILADGQWA